MNKFSKYSRRFVYAMISINLIILVLVDIYNYKQGTGLNNASLIIADIIFILLFHYTEKLYHNKITFIPQSYYYVAMLFAFFSTYLGSLQNYYERFDWWDNVLHLTSGVLIGFLSIVLVNLVLDNYIDHFPNKQDLLVIVVVGVLCAISVGVFWEFYEYAFDYLADGNMQRSIYFTGDNANQFMQYVRPSGRFIDPGLSDTMYDLFLATVGAIFAGVVSYLQLGKNLNN